MAAPPPPVGTIEGGHRFKGGDAANPASWEPVGPKSAPAWGQGAVELPDGSIVKYGPKGGTTVLKKGGGGADGDALTLTEDQGKQSQNAILMAEGETSYRRSRDKGYDPTTPVNSFANWLQALPMGMGIAPAAVIRDDAADRGRAAQMRWAEGSLRSRTGAAISEQETAREANMFYPGFGSGAPETVAEMERAREGSFRGTKARAGPGGVLAQRYPYTPQAGQSRIAPTGLTQQQQAAAGRYKGTKAPAGTVDNPSIPTTEEQRNALPVGAVYIAPDGSLKRKR